MIREREAKDECFNSESVKREELSVDFGKASSLKADRNSCQLFRNSELFLEVAGSRGIGLVSAVSVLNLHLVSLEIQRKHFYTSI